MLGELIVRFVVGLALGTMLLAGHAYAQVGQPGTPSPGVQIDLNITDFTGPVFGSTPIFDTTGRPALVQPGFVVLTEGRFTDPNQIRDPRNWSDVTWFQPQGTANLANTAFLFSDSESGISDFFLPPGAKVADILNAQNTVFLPEIDTGTGSDLVDFTNYTAGGAVYHIFSDAVQPELPEPPEGTPEPASFLLLGLGALCLAGYGWRRRQAAAA